MKNFIGNRSVWASRPVKSCSRYATTKKSSLALAVFMAGSFISGSAIAGTKLEEIVVTAQKRAENVQDVPLSIAVFSSEKLKELGAGVSRDLAAVTPNLQWKGDSDLLGNNIFLRGIGTNSLGAEAVSAVGIYVDEVGIVNSQAVGFFLFDLDRVEVLRGPQGTLYGRNSTGGAVNYHSKKPEIGSDLHGYIDVNVGSFEQRDLEAAVGFSVADNAAARISVLHKETEGAMDIKGANKESSQDADAVRGQVLWEPVESLSILANLHYGEVEGNLRPYKQIGLLAPAQPIAGFGPAGPIPNPCPFNPGIGSGCSDLFGFVDDDDYDSASADFVGRDEAETIGGLLNVNWELDGVTVTSITAYEDFESVRNQDVDASLNDILTQPAIGSSEQFTQEIRFSSTGDSRLNWIAGLYYSNENLDQEVLITTRGFGPGFVSMGPNLEGIHLDYTQETESYAIFGQAVYDISEKFSLTLGLRRTWEEKEMVHTSSVVNLDSFPDSDLINLNNDLSPFVLFPTIDGVEDEINVAEYSYRVALDYQVTEDILLFTSLTRSFKSGVGNSQATFDPLEAGLVDPEFLKAFEVGFKSTLLDNRLQLNGTLFYYDFTDQQVTIFTPTGSGIPVQVISNAGKSTIFGAEFELTAQLTENWLTTFGLGLLDTEYDEFDAGLLGDLSGNELAAAPEINFNGLIKYEQELGNGVFSAQVDFTYTDDQFFSANNDPILTEEGYWLAGARVAYKMMDEKLEVALWVKNLFDKEYVTDAFDVASFGYDLAQVGIQRRVGVNVRYLFD